MRTIAPQLPILVRSSTDGQINRLREAGATEVVPEIAEGSLILASHALALAGVPRLRVMRRVKTIRDGRYEMLQGFFHGADDSAGELIESEQIRLQAVRLAPDCVSIGRRLGDLDLNGARVHAIVRRSGRLLEPPPDLELKAGDTVVLIGMPDQIGAAEGVLQGA